MKASELNKHQVCTVCGQHPIASSGVPLFWRVRVERFGIDAGAVRRQQGLAMMLGSSALAGVMGTDEDVAQPLMDPVELTICERCAMDADAPPIAELAFRRAG